MIFQKAEAAFTEREHQAKLDAQNRILALNNEIILRQKVVNIFIGVVAVLVIILAIVLARSNKQKRIANNVLDEKVRQRTRELEANRDALQRAWQEKDLLITKASNDIRSSMATVKGLCFVGSKEIDHPKASEYFQKINVTSDQFADVVNLFSSIKADMSK